MTYCGQAAALSFFSFGVTKNTLPKTEGKKACLAHYITAGMSRRQALEDAGREAAGE